MYLFMSRLSGQSREGYLLLIQLQAALENWTYLITGDRVSLYVHIISTILTSVLTILALGAEWSYSRLFVSPLCVFAI